MPQSPSPAALPCVRTVGLTAFDPLWAEREHPTHDWEMMHILRGRVTLHMHGRRHRGEPGDTLLVPPGTMHRDAFDLEEGLEVVFCSFEWEPPEAAKARLDEGGRVDASPEGHREIRALFDAMRHDLATQGAANEALAAARIATILLLAARGTDAGGAKHETAARNEAAPRLMQRARAYLETHYAEILTLEGIAEALGVSPFHLSHVFSRESRTTLFAHLTDLRMARAADLIEQGGLTVTEVSEKVGYTSPNYFSKVFRRHFGCAPSEYRPTIRRR